MSKENIGGMLEAAIGRIREMMGTETVIGEAITLPGGFSAVPVCRVSVGFAAGGSDIASKSDKEMFGGGTGGGLTVTPIAFLVTGENGVRLMQLDTAGNTADNIVHTIPELVDRLSELLSRRSKDKPAGDDQKSGQ